MQDVMYTVCPVRLDPFYTVTYYIKCQDLLDRRYEQKLRFLRIIKNKICKRPFLLIHISAIVNGHLKKQFKFIYITSRVLFYKNY